MCACLWVADSKIEHFFADYSLLYNTAQSHNFNDSAQEQQQASGETFANDYTLPVFLDFHNNGNFFVCVT